MNFNLKCEHSMQDMFYNIWTERLHPLPLFQFHFSHRPDNLIGLESRGVDIKFTAFVLWQFSIKCKNEKYHSLDKHLNFHNQFTKCFYLQNWMNDSLRNLLTNTFFSTQPVYTVAMFQQLWGCYYFRMSSTCLHINSDMFFFLVYVWIFMVWFYVVFDILASKLPFHSIFTWLCVCRTWRQSDTQCRPGGHFAEPWIIYWA